MIEPELFNFKVPLNQHKYVTKQWDKLIADVDKYNLTHSISVVLPDTIFIPNHIENLFSEDGQYYYVPNVTLCSLIDPGFIMSFVKNGNIHAISYNTRINVEDCISITNNNLLEMCLMEPSYQNLCLPAHDSRIKLDLKELKLNSKYYQRIKDCFERFQTKFNLLISWKPNSDDVCSSSIASYFKLKGFNCHECFPRFKISRKYNMVIPTGTDTSLLDTWLSYFCLDIKIDDKMPSVLPDGKLTKSNSRYVGQVTQLNWTGFLSNDKVKLVLKNIRDFVQNGNKTHWVAIHMEPFSNSPFPSAHRTILLNTDDTCFVSYCTKCKKC